MPSTYTPIASTTLSATASQITFTGIPATYTDLVIILRNSKTTASGVNNNLRFNNDGTAIYGSAQYYGSGGAPGFLAQYNVSAMLAGIAQNDAVSIVHIFNYANTNMHKTILTRGVNANTYITMDTSVWRSTNAINRIDWINVTFTAGTTCTVYGIKAA